MPGIPIQGSLYANGPFQLTESSQIYGAPIIASELSNLNGWPYTFNMVVGQWGFVQDTKKTYQLTTIGNPTLSIPHVWTEFSGGGISGLTQHTIPVSQTSSSIVDSKVIQDITQDSGTKTCLKIETPADALKFLQLAVSHLWDTGQIYTSCQNLELWSNGVKAITINQDQHVILENDLYVGNGTSLSSIIGLNTMGIVKFVLNGADVSFFRFALGVIGGLYDNDVAVPIKLGDSTNTSLSTTNKTIVGAINELHAYSPLSAKKESSNSVSPNYFFGLLINTNGQTNFTISHAPSSEDNFLLYLNGKLCSGGTGNTCDYTRSGLNITWNNTGPSGPLVTNDELIVHYWF